VRSTSDENAQDILHSAALARGFVPSLQHVASDPGHQKLHQSINGSMFNADLWLLDEKSKQDLRWLDEEKKGVK
jgi:hypothetical protein